MHRVSKQQLQNGELLLRACRARTAPNVRTLGEQGDRRQQLCCHSTGAEATATSEAAAHSLHVELFWLLHMLEPSVPVAQWMSSYSPGA